jgi:hypothetical protein
MRPMQLVDLTFNLMVARGGIEPPTRGFSVGGRGF